MFQSVAGFLHDTLRFYSFENMLPAGAGLYMTTAPCHESGKDRLCLGPSKELFGIQGGAILTAQGTLPHPAASLPGPEDRLVCVSPVCFSYVAVSCTVSALAKCGGTHLWSEHLVELRQEDCCKFKDRLGSRVRPCLRVCRLLARVRCHLTEA